MKDVYFYFTALAITLTITSLKIGDIVRHPFILLSRLTKSEYFAVFIHCSACVGFWVGIILSYVWHSPSGFILIDGFLSLIFCLIVHIILNRLGMSDL